MQYSRVMTDVSFKENNFVPLDHFSCPAKHDGEIFMLKGIFTLFSSWVGDPSLPPLLSYQDGRPSTWNGQLVRVCSYCRGIHTYLVALSLSGNVYDKSFPDLTKDTLFRPICPNGWQKLTHSDPTPFVPQRNQNYHSKSLATTTHCLLLSPPRLSAAEFRLRNAN